MTTTYEQQMDFIDIQNLVQDQIWALSGVVDLIEEDNKTARVTLENSITHLELLKTKLAKTQEQISKEKLKKG